MEEFFSKKEQSRVYYPLKRHLGIPDEIVFPNLVIEDNETECKKKNKDLLTEGNIQDEVPWFKCLSPWFDRLGWYDSSEGNSKNVFLCKPLIEKMASRCKWNPKHLVQLVYAHELAHYFHFNMNKVGWGNNKKDRSCLEGHWERYVESFAQLCTHAIAKNFDTFGDKHLPILMYLTENSPDQYRYYKCKRLTTMARKVIIKFYLGTKEVHDDIEKKLQERQNEHIIALNAKKFENDVSELIGLLSELNSLGNDDDETLYNVVYQPFQNMIYLSPTSYSNQG